MQRRCPGCAYHHHHLLLLHHHLDLPLLSLPPSPLPLALQQLLNETRASLQESMQAATSQIEEEKKANQDKDHTIESLNELLAQSNQDLRHEREARRAEMEKVAMCAL